MNRLTFKTILKRMCTLKQLCVVARWILFHELFISFCCSSSITKHLSLRATFVVSLDRFCLSESSPASLLSPFLSRCYLCNSISFHRPLTLPRSASSFLLFYWSDTLLYSVISCLVWSESVRIITTSLGLPFIGMLYHTVRFPRDSVKLIGTEPSIIPSSPTSRPPSSPLSSPYLIAGAIYHLLPSLCRWNCPVFEFNFEFNII